MLNVLLGIIPLLCAVWVIYEIFTKQKKMKSSQKVIWTVCAIFFNIITAIVYYFLVYKKK